jgi:hypothetical protein
MTNKILTGFRLDKWSECDHCKQYKHHVQTKPIYVISVVGTRYFLCTDCVLDIASEAKIVVDAVERESK